MTHADGFLQNILAHPDDDAPRLIFADWLEEQGDAGSVARAEFIRLQCLLASGHSPPQRMKLENRQKRILGEFSDKWARPIRPLARLWDFHRGFIDEVTVCADKFLACADQLFRQAPIQHLHLWPRVVDGSVPRLSVAALADSEHLRRLRSLDLSGNRLESRGVRALMVSKQLTTLNSLRLERNQIGDSGIRALAEAPLLGQLTHLDLRSNDFGPAGLRVLARELVRLARSSEGLCMRIVDLQHNNLGSAGRQLVAESPLLRRVVRW